MIYTCGPPVAPMPDIIVILPTFRIGGAGGVTVTGVAGLLSGAGGGVVLAGGCAACEGDGVVGVVGCDEQPRMETRIITKIEVSDKINFMCVLLI